ncbi:MAG TPA: peptidoglycan editing factor PgeF [Chloroflexota bacterium]|nr:peptidoglycan editing factor PgeF [Chloroflexota bacterium]
MAASFRPDFPLFLFRSFNAIKGIAHGVTTRHGGVSRGAYSSLNLSLSVQDDEAAVLENKRRVSEAFNVSPSSLLTTKQVHGAAVIEVTDDLWSIDDSPRADALITDRPGPLLLQRFADCVPIFFAESQGRAVGLAHAGWRGTLLNVAAATVAALEASYRTKPSDLVVGIGPSIGPCCFEVGTNVADQFHGSPNVIINRQPRPHVDLWEANRLALMRVGVVPEAIEVARICTHCQKDDYFSHRALGYPAGRFGGVIGLTA